MPDHGTILPARRHRPRTRLAGAAGAAAAAVAVWLVVRYGAGLHPNTPGFGPAQRPASLAPGFVAVLSAAASLLAWAALTLIERTARGPRRVWVITGLITLAVSLSAPLSGHGVTGTDRLALICMHLAVGAVLVPVFALTIPRASSAGDDSMKSDSNPAFTAQRQQATRPALPYVGTIGKPRRTLSRSSVTAERDGAETGGFR